MIVLVKAGRGTNEAIAKRKERGKGIMRS